MPTRMPACGCNCSSKRYGLGQRLRICSTVLGSTRRFEILRGRLYTRLAQHLPAIADYSEVIRLDPERAVAYNYRAAAKLNMKDYRGAYLDYSQVLRILPEQAITYNNRAIARHQMGDCLGAITDLRIAVGLFKLQGDNFNYQRTLTNLKYFQKSKR